MFDPTPSRPPSPRYQANCAGCIFKTATCGSRGPLDSRFVIVGESPGQNEIRTGQPFIGESGKMLFQTLDSLSRELGLKYDAPFITNAISCVPGKKKDKTTVAKACRACHSRLVAEISLHPRSVIMALGNGALWSLLDDYTTAITHERGMIFPHPNASQGVVASVHPAFLLRGGGSFTKFRNDLRLAIQLLNGVPPHRYIDSEHTILETEGQLDDVVSKLLVAKPQPGDKYVYLGTDLETSGFSERDDYVLAAGFGWEFDTSYVVPGRLIRSPAARRLFTISKNRLRYVWHNGKFDVGFLRVRGIPARVDEDTMLLSYSQDENRGLHDLEQVSADACGAPNWKGMLNAYLPKKNASYAAIPKEVLYKYLGKDISATIQSFHILHPRIQADPDLRKHYSQLLIPSSVYLEQVEREGLLVDQGKVEENGRALDEEIARLAADINRIAHIRLGKSVNPGSPVQVAELLYDGIKLPTIRGSRSTDKDTLAMLPKNMVVDLITKYRAVAKLQSTYVRGLKKNVHKDQKVHPTFLLHGTVTGRLSCRGPNLQNIPRPTGSYVNIRAQFVPPPGWRFIEPDLNQAELRCLAELSRCPDLCAIYLDPNHPGLHHETSVALFGPEYNDEQKMRAKAVNFGIVYGRTAPSLSDEFKVTTQEGQRWIDAWFGRFPGASKFIDWTRGAPLRNECLITPFGNKRRFGVVSYDNRDAVQNEASNFPHQSIASHIMLSGSRRAFYTLRRRGFPIRAANLVHDSCLFLVPDDLRIASQVSQITIQFLEAEPLRWGLTYIPFLAEVKTGLTWGDMKKWAPYKAFPEVKVLEAKAA